MKWTPNDLNIAISLIKEGKTYDEISTLISRDKNSIRVKMGKIGENYLKYNPFTPIEKICIECNNKITHVGKKFCSQSCSITHNNRLRISKQINVVCITCNISFKTHQHDAKFCSRECFNLERKRIKDTEIESGECQTMSTRRYKVYLYEKHGEKCMKCGWNEVNEYTGKIPLELHHVDGNPDNNSLENLEILCPNHHSLTKNWKGGQKENGRYSKRRIKRRQDYADGKSC